MDSQDIRRFYRRKEGQAKNSWKCETCTFLHTGPSRQRFLVCQVCCAARRPSPGSFDATTPAEEVHSGPLPTSEAGALAARMAQVSPRTDQRNAQVKPIPSTSWGCLRAPSDRDISGPCKRRKGLDAPPPMMEYLIVLDFEWTADDKRRMEPVAEITQFPSVAMKLVDGTKASTGGTSTGGTDDWRLTLQSRRMLPADLTTPHSSLTTTRDAYAISAFDTFVRPTLNPVLTRFSIELTAITQAQVDEAPAIDVALERYMEWLELIHLVDTDGNRIGNWCFATWGDGDIMSTLRLELRHKSIALPPCFDRWINLKDDAIFGRHYGRDPRGGLRSCVESIGATWEGRAHNGLVDSINTAKIVRNMVRTGFRFTRPTRGLDKDGVPFGQKNRDRGERR